MKLKIVFALSFWGLLLIFSCNRDDISFQSPTQLLRFSRDTVFCDTVYNQVRSETYGVKVYNDEDQDIMIPKISLEKGNSSLYKINVDGKSGTIFTNVPLRKKDSLFIFVEIAPSISGSSEIIAEDRILFENPAGNQHINLYSTVQDAEFFIETVPGTNVISTNTTWTNNKAKIIFGDLTVEDGVTLNIQAGTKVYFHKNSGMLIGKSATLNVNGDLGTEVTFRGDRNDPKYDTIPKNWNGISMDIGSNLNMNYAKVFGGTTGLSLLQTNAVINNTIIHTHQEYGIMAINSVVNSKNLVMNNCGNADLGIYKGGNYTLTHATFANYWDFNSTLPGLAIYATNEYNNGTTTEFGALSLTLNNSICYTSAQNAIQFKPISGQSFVYQIQNGLLKYNASSAGFVFDANPNIQSSIQNQDPKFQNYYTEKMNLRVKADSPTKNKGNSSVASTVPLDIVKVSRTSNPTIGAYQ